MIRLVLADDEAMIRAGVRAILATDPGIEVVAEAADGQEAVALTLEHRPDVVLLDIRMPRMDGLAANAEIQRSAPGTGVVILTTFDEDEYIARALSEGASGFLLKSGDPRELVAGVRAVADGAAYLSPRVAHRVITELGTRHLARVAGARARLRSLTPRERDVLDLVGKGLSNQQIGRRLHLTEGTVKTYISAILTKLRVANRVQAAILSSQADQPSQPQG